jgi:hypothetical protein
MSVLIGRTRIQSRLSISQQDEGVVPFIWLQEWLSRRAAARRLSRGGENSLAKGNRFDRSLRKEGMWL